MNQPECVLVQPEMERGRSPLVNNSVLRDRDFQGIRVYRSDDGSSARNRFRRSCYRRDEPARLSLGVVAPP